MKKNTRVVGSAMAALAMSIGLAVPPAALAQEDPSSLSELSSLSSGSSAVDGLSSTSSELDGSSAADTGAVMDDVEEPDPVYRSGLPNVTPQGEPGTVLAEVPLDQRVGLDSASEQYRIAYTTVNQHDQPAVSTGAVFLPEGEKPEGGWPVLAWAHGTVGLADECAPSINPLSQVEADYLKTFLDEGYAIVASDYVGLDSPGFHSYLNGKVAAENVVDSVAAAHNMEIPQDSEPVFADKWSVIGQSQGGGVSLHVARQATGLSEDMGLDYRGAVATGAPAYVENLMVAAGPTFPGTPQTGISATYSLYILAAVQEANPDVDFDSALTDEGRRMIAESKKSCLFEVAEAMNGVSLAKAFNKPLREVPGADAAIRDFLTTPVSGYDKPVFLGHGLWDWDVPTPIGMVLNSEIWARQFIGNPRNNRVVVRWYPADHVDTMLISTRDSVPFLAGIMS